MASPDFSAPSPPPQAGPIGVRILFFVAGIVALFIGTVITLGAALAGAISIAVAAFVLHRRGKRLTRRGAWGWSVAGTVGVLAVLIGLVMLTDDQATKPISAADRAASRERAQQRMPDWIKAMNPNAGRQSAAADSMATQLLENRAVVIWAGLMGAVIASSIIGTIAGSFAWGGAMLIYRGYRGDWMPSQIDVP
jgi:hypothetical protein